MNRHVWNLLRADNHDFRGGVVFRANATLHEVLKIKGLGGISRVWLFTSSEQNPAETRTQGTENRPTPHRHEVWNIAAILRNILQFKISVFMWIYCTCDLFSIIPPVFSVTWSSEIIIICWFTAREIFLIIINVQNSCAASCFGGNSLAVNFSGLFNENKVQNNSIYFKQEPL